MTQIPIHELTTKRQTSRALDKHRSAMFILTQKDRPIPSLKEMKDDLEKDEYTSVKERIATLKQNHKSDLERMYVALAEDYLDDQRLRRDSRNDIDDETRDIYAPTDNQHYSSILSNALTKSNVTYTKSLLKLEKRKKEIERQKEEERRRRDAAFPQSISEFHSLPRDIQIRVASFLVGDPQRREKMMNDFVWAWRQVESLKLEMKSNPEFKSEVKRLAENLESRDPRRKR